MAAEASTNGDTQTPAQKLEARLAQEESHRPTVEDVPDEDDLAHPPPSTTAPALSEKAAGKQKAQDAEPTIKKSGANPPLNIQSEEMFPGLGAPKAHTPAAVSSAWGRKPASVSANGVNGAAASNGTSRASTPASGIATPTTPSVRGPGPQTMNLPGRYVESISLAPSQMVPRQLQKRPMQDVIRDINRRSKAKVEMKPGNMGNIVFQGTGPVDAVRSALREVARELGSKVCLRKGAGNKTWLTESSKPPRSLSPLRSAPTSLVAKVLLSRVSASAPAHVFRFPSRRRLALSRMMTALPSTLSLRVILSQLRWPSRRLSALSTSALPASTSA